MNLTRVLQPYVCCLGNPVAGNPTQFVMYRAARACGVDWRFFTSQVEVDQFEIAFRGVQALGLRGMALFEPFQNRAMSMLDSVTESALCLGGVNVARLDGNSWLGDNTLGIAIANCVETSLTLSPSPLTDGETENGNSPVVLVIGDSKVAKAIRLANPELMQRVYSVPATSESTSKSMESVCSDAATQPEFGQLVSLDEFGDKGLRLGCLIAENVPSPNQSRQLVSLSCAQPPSCLVLSNSTDKQMRLWKETMKSHEWKPIEFVELMTQQAVADFYFWTGVSPAIELIRDSLEEYMHW